jgi:uncharacterized RDD family membrane protein YckC
MFCPNCGTENSPDSKFCTSCGGPLQETSPVDQLQLEIVYVGFWRRSWATILDLIILGVPTLLILSAIYPNYWTSEAYIEGPMDFLLSWVVPAFYVIIFWSMKGATPGKMIAKVRIVDSQTFGQPSFGSLIGRYFGYFLSTIPLGLGILWVAWDKEKKGFHDKVAGTAVIFVRNKKSVD